MATIMGYYYSLFLVWFISTLVVHFLTKKFLRSSGKTVNHPPSPPALPVIGHLHLLGINLHKSLQVLSSRYGPLMRLKIGSSIPLIVSDAAGAGEIIKTHDLNFAYRPEFGASEFRIYKEPALVGSDYGAYWRFLKKICMTELLSTPQLNRSTDVRKEEVMKFLEVVMRCSDRGEACDLGPELMSLTNNIIGRLTMSTRCSGSANESKMIREFMSGIIDITGKLSLGEMLGPLKKLDLFGYGRRLRSLLMKYDKLVERIMKEHEEERHVGEKERKDMMDVLLQISEDEAAEVKLTRNGIKSFFLELFLAGTHSTSTGLQWTIAEIINHPDVFENLRDEIMAVVGPCRLVEESDLRDLPFLQAVVKESLRLHPPSPVILRRSKDDCRINGYDVLGNSRMIINVHAIMRSPDSWDNPMEFDPYRFLASTTENSYQDDPVNPKGSNLHYLPFGGGRRACPGAGLATTVMQFTIAMLVQCFDLRTKYGENVDMEEGSGFSAGMAKPLVCYPNLHINPFQLPTLPN